MPALTEDHIKILGPLIDPFQRSSNKPPFNIEVLRERGEANSDEFSYAIHDGIDNGRPTTPDLMLTVQERDENRILEGGKFLDKCYLWVIDEVSIKIMWEKTPNVLRGAAFPEKPYVCHTNITGCRQALAGGEMYFCEDGNIYINFSSDRYGYRGRDGRKNSVVDAMEFMNYKNVKIIEI
jgi:hypothetical protein